MLPELLHVVKLFGLQWFLKDNTFLPNIYLSIEGKSRIKTIGIPLSQENFTINSITREVISRTTAQLYDLLGIFLAPVILSCKVIMSRDCKITILLELDKPNMDIDPRLAELAFNFLRKLKQLDIIIPFIPGGGCVPTPV